MMLFLNCVRFHQSSELCDRSFPTHPGPDQFARLPHPLSQPQPVDLV